MDVPALLEQQGPAQGLVTRRQLLAAGISGSAITRAVTRGTLVRVTRRVYAAAPLPTPSRHLVSNTGPDAAYVAQVRACLLAHPTAAADGRTAAVLRGWGLLVEPGRTMEIAVPHGCSRATLPPARVIRSRRFARERRVVLPGSAPLALVPAVDVVAGIAAARALLEAVVACDSALRARDVTLEQLEREAAHRVGRQALRLSAVLRLADGRSESVLESVHRVRMVLGGITGFEPQVLVRDLPALRVDFCFRAQRLVVEVDGWRWHQDPVRDRSRDNALATLGWRVLHYTWGQVVHDWSAVGAQVQEALACGYPSAGSDAGRVRAA